MARERVSTSVFFLVNENIISFQQELTKAKEQLEAALQEKILDFEEMKRRLVKAVRYVSFQREISSK